MKNIVIIWTLISLGVFSSVAQNHKKHENFKAHKIAYITQSLELSPEEAEKFWPVYNNYEKKALDYRVLRNKKIGREIKEIGGVDLLEDQLVDQYINKLLENEQIYVNLKKKFYEDLKSILPAKKILKLYKTDGEFNRKILSEYRKKRHNTEN